jgi:hypothetical protein
LHKEVNPTEKAARLKEGSGNERVEHRRHESDWKQTRLVEQQKSHRKCSTNVKSFAFVPIDPETFIHETFDHTRSIRSNSTPHDTFAEAKQYGNLETIPVA